MRLSVLGATGRIGSAVVQHAVEREHAVTVLVRDPARLRAAAERLRVVRGDARDAAAVRAAVAGADAVVNALGPRGNTREDAAAHVEAVQTLLRVLSEVGVRRAVAVLGAAVDAEGDRKGPSDRLAAWLVRRAARWVYEAKRREFELLRATDLAWTAVRPPLVVPGPRTGRVQVRLDRPARPRVTTGDLADFLVREAEEARYVRQAPFVS